MIESFADAAEGIERETFDLCIVGTGAAGLCLAMQFAGTPYRVAVLEAGGRTITGESQAVYECETPELRHGGSSHGRFRVFGGSTTRWGGQALPFNPIDFCARPWVPYSGWPLAADAVAAYYPRAGQFMLVGDGDYAEDARADVRAEIPPLDPGHFLFQFSKFSRQPDLRRIYERPLRETTNVRVLREAHLLSLELAPGLDHVSEAVVSTPDLRRRKLRARVFVLAAGAVENARLLLASNRQLPEGIGNRHGLVGRFFQDHPGREIASVTTTQPDRLQRLFNIYYREGVKFKPRFSTAAAWQTAHRALSVSGVLLFESAPTSAFNLLRDALHDARLKGVNADVFRRALRGLGKSGELLPTVWQRWRHGRTTIRSRASGVRFRRTGAGPRVAGPAFHHPGRSFRHAVDRVEMAALGVAGKEHLAFFGGAHGGFPAAGVRRDRGGRRRDTDFAAWKDSLYDNNHHMGTTRMSHAAADGVVDPDCRVHGVDNLYVAGGSVFPTGGHSNPTLTLLALALRLADRLKQTL